MIKILYYPYASVVRPSFLCHPAWVLIRAISSADGGNGKFRIRSPGLALAKHPVPEFRNSLNDIIQPVDGPGNPVPISGM